MDKRIALAKQIILLCLKSGLTAKQSHTAVGLSLTLMPKNFKSASLEALVLSEHAFERHIAATRLLRPGRQGGRRKAPTAAR
jgi:hypothetical protein